METLISEELLTRKECDSVDFGADELSVDYEKQYAGLREYKEKLADETLAKEIKEITVRYGRSN